MVGLNIYFGAALAELSNQLSSSPAPSRPNPLNHLLPWFLLLVGLYVSGYPELSPDWTAWSQNLANIGLHIFPSPNDHWRFWTSVGVQLVTVAVVLYPMFQKFLSHPALVWLGGLSFPLYLIHGPLIRTVLAWMLFGWQEPQYFYNNDENGNVTDKWVRIPFPSGWVFCIALPVYFVLLFWLSHLWSLWIDPWCASKVKNLEEIMYGDVSSEKLERPRKESGHLLCAV